ncbi:hypothetical protein C8R46DRAFT_1223321 [Mycena filopes]|nr:hypothetical protein C8R46DRAFT_1223321 [Mycena filopes]
MNRCWRVASRSRRHYSSSLLPPRSRNIDDPALIEEELKPLRRTKIPPLSTLSPARLKRSDLIEELPFAFQLFYRAPQTPDLERSLGLQHRGAKLAWTDAIPPSPCRGFLYFHNPRPSIPLAASLRFRLTPDYNGVHSPQAAFAAGLDLPIPGSDGRVPWSIPVWTLVKYPVFSPLCGILRAEGAKLPPHKWPPTREMDEFSVLLHALGQPFLVDFSLPSLLMWIPQHIHYPEPLPARIEPGFVDLKTKKHRMPYIGLAVMALEPLEDGIMGIQLQKILSLRQQYANENVPPPVEGETRSLGFLPLFQKEATKPKGDKFDGKLMAVHNAIRKLPHL